MDTLNNVNDLCRTLVPPGSKVLELGCANALMGKHLESDLGCRVTGVEINSQLVKEARKNISLVILGDIQKQDVQKEITKLGKFDVILAMAILEHLYKPRETMKKMFKYLTKDGLIFISLPNIAYWQIRLSLIQGKFNYQDSGILDKTHLRFFTLKTALDFITKDCRLITRKTEFEFTKLPIISRLLQLLPGGEKVEKKFFSKFPGFFAYQFLFICTKA